METDRQDTRALARRWFKRAGIGGVVFFTVKGLLWLLVPMALLRCAGQ